MDNMEDLVGMIEKAKMLSSMFGGNNEKNEDKPNQENESQPLDFEKMAQIIEMMNMFKSKEEPPTQNIKATTDNNFPIFTETASPAIESIKGAIPYLDYPYQKYMLIGLKALEMQTIVNNYQTYTQDIKASQGENWKKGVLYAIRPYMDDNKKNFIDVLFKCLDVKEIMSKMNIQNDASA